MTRGRVSFHKYLWRDWDGRWVSIAHGIRVSGQYFLHFKGQGDANEHLGYVGLWIILLICVCAKLHAYDIRMNRGNDGVKRTLSKKSKVVNLSPGLVTNLG